MKDNQNMFLSSTFASYQNPLEESEDTIRFNKSLQELKDLSSQLQNAADYSIKKYLNAKENEKKVVVENTKEYICRAVVAVVDHLGCVSFELDTSISKTHSFSDADNRINCLKQRLLACELYVHKLALNRLMWSPRLPEFSPRYLSTPLTAIAQKSNEDIKRNSSSPSCAIDAKDLPLSLYTRKGESHSSLVLPARDGLTPAQSDVPNSYPTFHFERSASVKQRRNASYFRKSIHMQGNDLLSLIRRTKRTT